MFILEHTFLLENDCEKWWSWKMSLWKLRMNPLLYSWNGTTSGFEKKSLKNIFIKIPDKYKS